MIRREHRELGDAARGVEADGSGERLSGGFGLAHEARMGELVRQIDLEPIGRIKPLDIGVERALGQVLEFRRELGAEFGLRHGDALGAIDLGKAAGEHRLGLVIERAQQLRLPAVPHAGADGADIGGGENGQKLQPLQRLHHRGEILDGPAVGEVARLRHGRHHQMHFDQPGDELGIGGIEPEPRRQSPRQPRACDRVVLDAALGDVVQEQRDAEHGIMLRLDGLDQLVGEHEFRIFAARDLVEHADAAEQMLVHRIVVIHVELHHRHDAAEGVNEGAEHADFVHPPQHDLGGVLRGQDFQEQLVGFLDPRARPCR